MRKIIVFCLVALVFSLCGCGGGSGGSSNSSSPNQTVTAPDAPTGVSANGGAGQVTISWDAVSGAESYNIYWATSSGVTTTSVQKIAGAVSPFIHAGLQASTPYYYIITAINSGGESSASSEVTASTSAVEPPPLTIPSAPQNIAASSATGQISLSWNAVTGATSYNMYWSNTSGLTISNGMKVSNVTSPFVQTGITDGTTRYYIVTAANDAGESNASAQVSATTPTVVTPSNTWLITGAQRSVILGDFQFVASQRNGEVFLKKFNKTTGEESWEITALATSNRDVNVGLAAMNGFVYMTNVAVNPLFNSLPDAKTGVTWFTKINASTGENVSSFILEGVATVTALHPDAATNTLFTCYSKSGEYIARIDENGNILNSTPFQATDYVLVNGSDVYAVWMKMQGGSFNRIVVTRLTKDLAAVSESDMNRPFNASSGLDIPIGATLSPSGSLYVGVMYDTLASNGSALLELDLETGTWKNTWIGKIAGFSPYRNLAFSSDGKLFSIDLLSSVVRVNPTDGTAIWKKSMDVKSITVDGLSVYVSSESGEKIVILNQSTGAITN